MPSIFDIKPQFQKLLRPSVNMQARLGVTANQLTIAAALLSFAVGVVLTLKVGNGRWLLLLPAVFLVRMALNVMDGMLAREHNQTSSRGAVLNELGDALSDAALYAPLALWPGFPPAIMVGIVVLSVTSELAGVVALQIGVSRRYDGPMGKSNRALVIGAVALALGLGVQPGRWLVFVLGLVVALLVQTIWNRARRALAQTVA